MKSTRNRSYRIKAINFISLRIKQCDFLIPNYSYLLTHKDPENRLPPEEGARNGKGNEKSGRKSSSASAEKPHLSYRRHDPTAPPPTEWPARRRQTARCEPTMPRCSDLLPLIEITRLPDYSNLLSPFSEMKGRIQGVLWRGLTYRLREG